MRDEQAARYGRYHADPGPEQLTLFFYLSPPDIRFLANYRRSYPNPGAPYSWVPGDFWAHFCPFPPQVPAIVVQTLSQQLLLPAEAWNGSTPLAIAWSAPAYTGGCLPFWSPYCAAHCANSAIARCR